MADYVRSVFVLDRTEYTKYTKTTHGDVYKYLEKLARQLEVRAKAQVNKRSGALAASIKSSVEQHDGEISIRIGSPLNYALLVHEGTKPHVITAHGGRLLRFTVRGQIVYARRVYHPGTRPNRYLTDNIRKVVS